MCEAIVGLYAFTGCDTISSFAGKGKLPALRIMRKSDTFIDTFSALGRSLEVEESTFADLEQFVCALYGNAKVSSVSDLRYGMFCAKGARFASHLLPPSRSSLRKHILHANYQAYI